MVTAWTGTDGVSTAWVETDWTGTGWTDEEPDDVPEDDWYATDWMAGVAVAFTSETLYVVALVLSAKEFGKAYCENIKSAVNAKKRITLLFMSTIRQWVNKKLWHNVHEHC